jgi:hypothetical protein
MNGLAVPEDGPGEFHAVTPTDDRVSERKSTRLGAVVEARERQREALIASAVALEFGRLVPLADARRAAAYSASVIDCYRLLSAGNAQTHASLLRGQLKWLRGLKPGDSRTLETRPSNLATSATASRSRSRPPRR